MDAYLERAVRARFIEYVNRFFPKYDDAPTGILGPPNLELGILGPAVVNDFFNFLDDSACQLLMRLTYIPVTCTSHMEQAGCGMCGQAYASRLHVPVKLRCGCVYGEGCVVSHLANCVLAPVVTICQCPAPQCRQLWTPVYEWEQMRRHHPGFNQQSWLQEFERMERGKFLHVMWIRWMEIALITPAESRPVIIIQDDEGAIRAAHDGITHPSYRTLVTDRATPVWDQPIIRDGQIVKYLAKYFAQLVGEQFAVSEATIRHFRAAIVAYISCLLDETEQDHSHDETIFVLERYTDKLIQHTLVQMRINMKMLF